MTKDLEEYYKNINYKNKLIVEYEDKEGNYFPITPAQLFVAVQYQILNQKDYEKAVFQQLIPKDFKCNEKEIDKPIPKNEITKKDEDKNIITTIKEKVKEVWFVSNNLGIRKAYNNKEEAMQIAKEINQKIYEVYIVE